MTKVIVGSLCLIVALFPAQSPATDEPIKAGQDVREWMESVQGQALKENGAGSEDIADKEWIDRITGNALEKSQALLHSEDQDSLWADMEEAGEQFSGTLTSRPGLPPVMVFVSFSMPESSLQGWLHEAERAQIPLILRGLKNDLAGVPSITETARAIQGLLGEENRGAILIDPTLFRRFEVEVVPTVVAASEPIAPCSTRNCVSEPIPPHDRLTGNIPLATALRVLAGHNGEGTKAAQAAFRRLTKERE